MAKTLKNMKQDFKKLEEFFAELPLHIANAYQNLVDDNFDQEGFQDSTLEKWPKRTKTDTTRGGKKKKGKRSLLVQSGKLRRSISYRIVQQGGSHAIIFYSNVPYAQIHNEGGAVKYTAKIKAHTRKTKSGKVQVKAHKRRVSFNMPKRQFIGRSASFDEEIVTWVSNQIEKLID